MSLQVLDWYEDARKRGDSREMGGGSGKRKLERKVLTFLAMPIIFLGAFVLFALDGFPKPAMRSLHALCSVLRTD